MYVRSNVVTMRVRSIIATFGALLLCSASAVDADLPPYGAGSAVATRARGFAPPLFSQHPSDSSEITTASQIIINNTPINGEIATIFVPGLGKY